MEDGSGQRRGPEERMYKYGNAQSFSMDSFSYFFFITLTARRDDRSQLTTRLHEPAKRLTFSRDLARRQPAIRERRHDLDQWLERQRKPRSSREAKAVTNLLIEVLPHALVAHDHVRALQRAAKRAVSIRRALGSWAGGPSAHFFSFSIRQHSLLRQTSCQMMPFIWSVRR